MSLQKYKKIKDIYKTIIVNRDVNYRQFEEKSLSAQKNAARCIGGQDKDVFSLEDAPKAL